MPIVLPYDQFNNGDTGACNPDAILPVANGEAANQTVFRRPTEILRARTELVRLYMDWMMGLTDQCRGLSIVSDPSVMINWDGSKFTTTGEFRIAPMLSSGLVTASNNIPAQAVIAIAGPPAGYFSIRSKDGLQSWEGANALKYKIYYTSGEGSSGGDPTITVTGSKNPNSGDFDPIYGPLLLSVKLSHYSSAINTTWAQVVTAINNDATANDFFYASVTAGGPDGLYATTVGERYISLDNGAVDSCAFRIPAPTFVSFFAGAGSSGLSDGDALFISLGRAYDMLAHAGGSTISESWLDILHYATVEDPPTSAEPTAQSGGAWSGFCLPIGRRVGSNFVLLNGTVCPTGVAVKLVPDTALRNDLTLTTTGVGAEMVGAGAHTVATAPTLYDLAPGTVKTQTVRLEEIAALNATNMVTLTVGSDGTKFDYTTIQAAITAVNGGTATGATINVSSGTYTESLTLPASKPILFIGQGMPIVRRLAGGSVVLTTANGNAQHRFIGFSFQTAEPTVALVDATTGTYTDEIIFEQCSFARTAASSTEIAMIASKRGLRFSSCTFAGMSSQYDKLFDVQAATSKLTVENSAISELKTVMTNSSGIGGTLIFRKNRLYNCGYTSSGSSISTLFSLAGGTGMEICDITDSVWEDTGDANELGKFIDVLPTTTGVITICNNQILRDMTTTLTAAAYMVKVEFAANARSLIDNNMITCGKLAAIAASGNVHITRNKITVTADSTYAFAAIINGGVFSQNTIVGSNSAVISGVVYVSTSTTGVCEISNNDITWSATANVNGIYAQDVEARIEGNVLAFSGTFTGIGIVCSTTTALVRGNKMTGFSSGVTGNLGALTITDNQIVGSSGTAGITVTTDNVTSLHVRGNVITSFLQGILLSKSSTWGTFDTYISENSILTIGSGQRGINLDEANDAFVSGNKILGTAGDTTSVGILSIDGASGSMLQNNEISIYNKGVSLNGHNAVVSSNRVHTSKYPLALESSAQYINIVGNRLVASGVSGATGILLADAGSTMSLRHVISSNAISGYDSGGSGYGIDFGSATNNQDIAVSGNFFSDTNQYVRNHTTVGIGVRGSGAALTYDSTP